MAWKSDLEKKENKKIIKLKEEHWRKISKPLEYMNCGGINNYQFDWEEGFHPLARDYEFTKETRGRAATINFNAIMQDPEETVRKRYEELANRKAIKNTNSEIVRHVDETLRYGTIAYCMRAIPKATDRIGEDQGWLKGAMLNARLCRELNAKGMKSKWYRFGEPNPYVDVLSNGVRLLKR